MLHDGARLLAVMILALVSPGIMRSPQVPTKSLPLFDSRANSWEHWPTEAEFQFNSRQAIDVKDVFEVVGTERDTVVEFDLRDRSFEKIDEVTAKSRTGHYYRCPEGKTPYLVRAVYGHGRQGAYGFERAGRKLWIHHRSLGNAVNPHKSAFVMNLDFEPEVLYVSLSFAL